MMRRQLLSRNCTHGSLELCSFGRYWYAHLGMCSVGVETWLRGGWQCCSMLFGRDGCIHVAPLLLLSRRVCPVVRCSCCRIAVQAQHRRHHPPNLGSIGGFGQRLPDHWSKCCLVLYSCRPLTHTRHGVTSCMISTPSLMGWSQIGCMTRAKLLSSMFSRAARGGVRAHTIVRMIGKRLKRSWVPGIPRRLARLIWPLVRHSSAGMLNG